MNDINPAFQSQPPNVAALGGATLGALLQHGTAMPVDAPTQTKHQNRLLSTYVLLFALVGDSLVVFVALMFSSWLRFETELNRLGSNTGSVYWTDYIGLTVFGTLLFVFLLPHDELYDLHRMRVLRMVVPAIIKTALRWLFAYLTFTWVFRSEMEMSRIYAAIAFTITTTALVGWRSMVSFLLNGEKIAKRIKQRIVFVGWSPQSLKLAQTIAVDDAHPYDVAGYISARQGDQTCPCPVPRLAENADEMVNVLREHRIDIVIQADLDAPMEKTLALVNLCEREMVEFKVIPNCFQILLSGLQLQTVSGVPVLGISYLPLNSPANVLIKNIIDFLGGVIGLLLSFPVIGFFGLWVYLEDRGPVIYRQRRIGRNGRPFWILKIRSMKLDAERDGKAGWTVTGDPRRLGIGAFMRRWNIDELPQFWNVVKGEMSLVGPRPERPELIFFLKEKIPHYNARHSIKPGITGWAQVNGFRGDTDLNERIRCDLYYMEHWSVVMDFQILFMTIFNRKNAC